MQSCASMHVCLFVIVCMEEFTRAQSLSLYPSSLVSCFTENSPSSSRMGKMLVLHLADDGASLSAYVRLFAVEDSHVATVKRE